MSAERVEQQLKAKQKQQDEAQQRSVKGVSKSASLTSSGQRTSPSPLRPNKLDFSALNLSKSSSTKDHNGPGPMPLSSDFFDSLIAPQQDEMDQLLRDIVPDHDMFGVKRSSLSQQTAESVPSKSPPPDGEGKASHIIDLKATSSHSAGPRKLMIKKKSSASTPTPVANGHRHDGHSSVDGDDGVAGKCEPDRASTSSENVANDASSHNGHAPATQSEGKASKSRVKMVRKEATPHRDQGQGHHHGHSQSHSNAHHRHHLGLVWDALTHCQQEHNTTPRRVEMYEAMKKVHPDYMRNRDRKFADECIDSCLAAGVVEEFMEGRISSLYLLPVILNALTDEGTVLGTKSASGHIWITVEALREHLSKRYDNHLASYFTLTYIYRIICNATRLFAFHKDDKPTVKRPQSQLTDKELQSIRFRVRKKPTSSTSPVTDGRSVSPPYGAANGYDYGVNSRSATGYHSNNGYYRNRQHHGHPRARNPNHYNSYNY